MKKVFHFVLLVLFASACSGKPYKVTDNGVIVNVAQPHEGGARKVRLQVIADGIVRVTETAGKGFSDMESLMVLPLEGKAGQPVFSVKADGDSCVLLTMPSLTARVRIADGTVSFTEAEGHAITGQVQPTEFTPVEVDGTHGYSTLSRFSTVEGEGLYGLGQHQSDEWNYRGLNEDLYQYNTKISIPFVISSRNYGILWDTYSHSRFGNPEDFMQLNRVFRLYDRDGQPGHLTGSYVQSPRFPLRGGTDKLPVQVRNEDSLFYANSEMIKLLPPLGPSVDYEGYIEAPESGSYQFLLYYAGYVKVWVNDSLVVPERWRTAWNPNSYKFFAELEKDRRYKLKVEWRPDGSTSYFGLRAYPPANPSVQNDIRFWTEMVPEQDWYFISSQDMDGVISGLRTLTGKATVMPKWAMGFWQSREHYRTQDEIVSTLKEFRDRHIGIDNIVQDWNYWPEDAWGSHEFDAARYPDPAKMVQDIHDMNAHVMISVWPKFYMTTEHYKEFDANGWMYTRAVEDSIRDWVGRGYIGSFYDAYSEGARKLFWNQMEDHLYKYGFDAWWMDASEPNIRDCVPLEYQKQLTGPTALGPSTQYFMAYALMNARAIWEGLREADADTRVFQLTRNGYAGMQRYAAASWSGDIGARWEDMRSQITAGMNYSLCGNPYWTMDIGGFCVENRYQNAQRMYERSGWADSDLEQWRELQTRWYQFGTFVPLYRAHGPFPLREVFNIAPEDSPAYNSIVEYNRLRYRLMPYIYSLAGAAWLQDYTIMRGLVMDYASDPMALDISDQYMFGPSLMICPVYEYNARERKVYLPSGQCWYDFNSNRIHEGGQTIVADAPYEKMPMFVPAGAMLVYGPDVEYADQNPAVRLSVHVYAGKDGSFTLYEDDGVTYAYEQGGYSLIPFAYDDSSRTLTIGERVGTYEGMIGERQIDVILHSSDADKTLYSVSYSGAAVVIALK